MMHEGAENWGQCPVCGREVHSGEGVDIEGHLAIQRVTCGLHEWTETYKASHRDWESQTLAPTKPTPIWTHNNVAVVLNIDFGDQSVKGGQVRLAHIVVPHEEVLYGDPSPYSWSTHLSNRVLRGMANAILANVPRDPGDLA